MPLVAAAAITTVGGLAAAKMSSSAAKKAANTQAQAADLATAEQRRQFDAATEEQRRQFEQTRADNLPFLQAGQRALAGQFDLLGLNGSEAQGTTIEALRNSPLFAALMRNGEEAILSNASATGGLRGGNVQSALANFRADLLARTIQDRIQTLGGLTGQGATTAGNLGQFGSAYASGIGQQGQAFADSFGNIQLGRGAAVGGARLAGGQAGANAISGIAGGIGNLLTLRSMGVFDRPQVSAQTPGYGGGMAGFGDISTPVANNIMAGRVF